jgi:hypothetical protein
LLETTITDPNVFNKGCGAADSPVALSLSATQKQNEKPKKKGLLTLDLPIGGGRVVSTRAVCDNRQKTWCPFSAKDAIGGFGSIFLFRPGMHGLAPAAAG